MRRLLLSVLLAAAAVPAVAQQNPFRLVRTGPRSGEVAYVLGGDQTGTSTLAFDGERQARHQNGTMKMMGKTTTVDSWTLTTADSFYVADLVKKTGTAMPNMLPLMARAYDDLDGPGKKRLHQNMQDMAAIIMRGFGVSSVSGGEKLGTKTYAGQECEEREFGGFVVCTMAKAPVMLHSKGTLVCFTIEETATEVRLGSASESAFAFPPGVTFTPNSHVTNADSTARGFVNYLASEALADSLAKSKAAMAKDTSTAKTAKQTPEQQASTQQACQAIMNFDMGKVMADASDAWAKAVADALKRAAKDAAASKIKGLLKKPRIP